MQTSIAQQTIGVLIVAMLVLVAGTSVAQTAAAAGETITVEPLEELNVDELQELVGPIALYPDDLVAIILPASTYPLQIVEAARFREASIQDPSLEPDEDWDESVVALLNYPEALTLLNDDLDWTWSLGQAVLAQQEDVLEAIKVFRLLAYDAGNLKSDERQIVDVEPEAIEIRPADPEVIYVPHYEPEKVIVYQPRRVYHYYPRAYPVYYYPYYHDRYYTGIFWGISSWFSLSWDHHYIGHYHHHHYRHPYYARHYHHDHFRRTHRYHRDVARDRRWASRYGDGRHHRRHDRNYADRGDWQPDVQRIGPRPDRRYAFGGERRRRGTAMAYGEPMENPRATRDFTRRNDDRRVRDRRLRERRHDAAPLARSDERQRRSTGTVSERRSTDVSRGEQNPVRATTPPRSTVHRDTRRERNAVARRSSELRERPRRQIQYEQRQSLRARQQAERQSRSRSRAPEMSTLRREAPAQAAPRVTTHGRPAASRQAAPARQRQAGAHAPRQATRSRAQAQPRPSAVQRQARPARAPHARPARPAPQVRQRSPQVQARHSRTPPSRNVSRRAATRSNNNANGAQQRRAPQRRDR